MKTRWQSYVLLGLQLAALGYLLFSGPLFVLIDRPLWLALELIGTGIGAWSIIAMRFRNLHAMPDVAPDAQLVTHGPYRRVRHPIYFAVLLIFGGMLGNHCTPLRAAVFVLLAVVLDIKCRYEERLLTLRFAAYGEYQRRTKRLIPFVY